MTRYLERAEDTARLINATTMLLIDMPPAQVSAGRRC
jgi:Bacterial domain of unknown function (DUF403).